MAGRVFGRPANVRPLAVALRVSEALRSSAHDLRKADPTFGAEVRAAIAEAAERRRNRALERAQGMLGRTPGRGRADRSG